MNKVTIEKFLAASEKYFLQNVGRPSDLPDARQRRVLTVDAQWVHARLLLNHFYPQVVKACSQAFVGQPVVEC